MSEDLTPDLARMREVAEKALVPFIGGDRPTTEPGGCDCQLCGAIFVGAIQHTTCAGCEAQEEHRRSANPAAVLSLLDRIAELAEGQCDLVNWVANVDANFAEEHAARLAAEAQVSALQAQVGRARDEGRADAYADMAAQHEEDAQEYNRLRDPGMANHQRKYARDFRVRAENIRAALSQPPADEPAKGEG